MCVILTWILNQKKKITKDIIMTEKFEYELYTK